MTGDSGGWGILGCVPHETPLTVPFCATRETTPAHPNLTALMAVSFFSDGHHPSDSAVANAVTTIAVLLVSRKVVLSLSTCRNRPDVASWNTRVDSNELTRPAVTDAINGWFGIEASAWSTST